MDLGLHLRKVFSLAVSVGLGAFILFGSPNDSAWLVAGKLIIFAGFQMEAINYHLDQRLLKIRPEQKRFVFY